MKVLVENIYEGDGVTPKKDKSNILYSEMIGKTYQVAVVVQGYSATLYDIEDPYNMLRTSNVQAFNFGAGTFELQTLNTIYRLKLIQAE